MKGLKMILDVKADVRFDDDSGDIAVRIKPVVLIQPNTDVALPPMFDVVYVNDDKTSFEFVIASLIQFFNYNETDAQQMAQSVDQKGKATVASMLLELAQQKSREVMNTARSYQFPLVVEVKQQD